ncbi:scyllo-inositol 2-dehydrogenase (NADP(+)) IolU [bioreactor metagenome]|uniref:Scyllo-inositol 2-dehydrogenase (NADP(+)) IolU n=1 Tax=bioreactor metagenome TaxID=1076179 RepID=A0A645CE82_9ZZZZ
MDKIRFGILGPGKISHRFMKGIAFAEDAEVVAVASRDLMKAEAFKSQYGLRYAYDDYVKMLENPEVDMVYIATIPSMHYEQIMLCLRYHKHVICEKPLLADSAAIKECFAYAGSQGLFLMEAQKAPFNYLNQEIKRRLEQGIIGQVKYIEAAYCYASFAQNYEHWVYRREDGGGMFDVGVYAIAYANMMAGSPLQKIQAMADRTPTGCDGFAVAMLEYENGVKAVVKGAIELNTENKALIYGTEGYIETVNFWKNTKATIYRGDTKEDIEIPMPTDFYPEIEAAVSGVKAQLLQSPIMNEEASLQIMKVLEYVRQV